jgi:paraquat-inducible protein B
MHQNNIKYFSVLLMLIIQVNCTLAGNGKKYRDAVAELTQIIDAHETLNANNLDIIKAKVNENYKKLNDIKLNYLFNFRKKKQRNSINRTYSLLKKSLDFIVKVKLDSVNLDSIQLPKFKMDPINCCLRKHEIDSNRSVNPIGIVECITNNVRRMNYDLISEYSYVLCNNQQNMQKLTEQAIYEYLPNVQNELREVQKQINDIIRVLNNQEFIVLNIIYYDLKKELIRDNYIN